MTTTRLLQTAWDWEPSVLLGCLALILLYAVAVRGRPDGRGLCFLAGVLTLLVSLLSPIDVLGDRYLFSAHMLQHLLLILVAPPLLLLGLPRAAVAQLLRRPAIARLESTLRRPVLAWALAVTTLWVWHWPPLYDAALASTGLHVVEHLCFLLSATIFWWPVLTPLEEYRLPVGALLVYVLAASLANDVLGIIITFAPVGLYPPYLAPAGDPAVIRLIREGWGISAADDQQMAGVLMWIPSNLPYLAALIAALARWYDEPETDILPQAVPDRARLEEA